MKIEQTLDVVHGRLTANRWLQLFTVFTRVLLAVGFIPPSYKKIIHVPFTSIPDSNPVGHYYNALYQTGFYYEFLGWAQMIAAVLLLFPRTAHLRAVLFLPIIANIAVLTSAVGFKGTWLLTIFMTLAATYLVAWDYDRLKPLIFQKREDRPDRPLWQLAAIPLVFAGGGIAMAGIWKAIGLGNFPDYFQVGMMLTVAGAIFGTILAVHYRFMAVGKLNSSREAL